ncbi:MAG: hydrogenase maturation nickel metallochaperone HypA [Pseudomonadota bacterium]
MALCSALLRLIEEVHDEEPFAHVRRIDVALGALSHVAPEALRFCFAAASRGTRAEGAVLHVLERESEALCLDCNAMTRVRRPGQACGQCQGHRLILGRGDEMRLESMEVC